MQEIIGSILDIEKKANRILEQGYAQKKEIDERFRAELINMKKDIDDSVRKKLAKIEAEERKEAEERITKIEKAAEKKLFSMNEIYRLNKDNWVDSVFNNIVRR